MSRRGRQDEEPMSFFSFQDIIACITGIMVLITMLLALELATRKPARGKEESELAGAVRDARGRLAGLQEEFDDAEEMINDRSGRPIITRERVEAKKKGVVSLTDANSTVVKQLEHSC